MLVPTNCKVGARRSCIEAGCAGCSRGSHSPGRVMEWIPDGRANDHGAAFQNFTNIYGGRRMENPPDRSMIVHPGLGHRHHGPPGSMARSRFGSGRIPGSGADDYENFIISYERSLDGRTPRPRDRGTIIPWDARTRLPPHRHQSRGPQPGPLDPRDLSPENGWAFQRTTNPDEGQRGKIYYNSYTDEQHILNTTHTYDLHPNGRESLEVYIFTQIIPSQYDKIVAFHWSSVDSIPQRGNELSIRYDYYPGGDLRKYLEGNGSRAIPVALIWHIFYSIAGALAMLHHGHDRRNHRPLRQRWEEVVHRNVTASNIFLSYDPNDFDLHRRSRLPKVVLGGFEKATLQHRSLRAQTPHYNSSMTPAQPPEAPEWTAMSDVWCLAEVVQEMIDRSHGRRRNPRVGGRDDWCVINGDGYNGRLETILGDCLDSEPLRRPDSMDLAQWLWADRPR